MLQEEDNQEETMFMMFTPQNNIQEDTWLLLYPESIIELKPDLIYSWCSNYFATLISFIFD